MTNHLGSVAARMGISGSLSETYRYLPFGERYAGTQTTHQFTGKERDSESGLDYFGARYLTSNHGRWMSVDPVFRRVHDPQSLNRYVYSRNDPIGKLDPNGEEWRIVECGVADTGVRIIGIPGTISGSEYYCIYNWYPDAPPPTSPPARPPTREMDPTRRWVSKSAENECFSNWAKDLLTPYFPDLDLDSIPMVPLGPWQGPGMAILNAAQDTWADAGFTAITLYPFVFYDPESPWTDIETPAGITTFAHEFTHVQQVENLTPLRGYFYVTYVMWYAYNLFTNGGDASQAYRDIGFEQWANENAAVIWRDVKAQLESSGGRRVCRGN